MPEKTTLCNPLGDIFYGGAVCDPSFGRLPLEKKVEYIAIAACTHRPFARGQD
jgi:hypothetical protein